MGNRTQYVKYSIICDMNVQCFMIFWDFLFEWFVWNVDSGWFNVACETNLQPSRVEIGSTCVLFLAQISWSFVFIFVHVFGLFESTCVCIHACILFMHCFYIYIIFICICYNWFHMCASCWLKSIRYLSVFSCDCIVYQIFVGKKADCKIRMTGWSTLKDGKCIQFLAPDGVMLLICTYLHISALFHLSLFLLGSVFTDFSFHW